MHTESPSTRTLTTIRFDWIGLCLVSLYSEKVSNRKQNLKRIRVKLNIFNPEDNITLLQSSAPVVMSHNGMTHPLTVYSWRICSWLYERKKDGSLPFAVWLAVAPLREFLLFCCCVHTRCKHSGPEKFILMLPLLGTWPLEILFYLTWIHLYICTCCFQLHIVYSCRSIP